MDATEAKRLDDKMESLTITRFLDSVVISILSMTSGISGANFWIPVYLFFIELNPKIVFWLALLTMLFGFGSGVIRNIYQGTVNWYIVKQYLIPTVPAAVVGSLLASYVNEKVLIFIFSSFIFIYGTYQLIVSTTTQKAKVKHQKVFWKVGIIAGFLKGLIATGLGKLIVPGMWNHEKIKHPSEVIGSAVVIIFIVNIVAALTRMNPAFVNELIDNRHVAKHPPTQESCTPPSRTAHPQFSRTSNDNSTTHRIPT